MSLLDDLATLRRAGVLRPLGPRTSMQVFKQVLFEGIKPHLVYTIHGTQEPERAALIHDGRVTTWGGLLERIRRLSNHLLSSGVGPGSGVAVMLGNRPEFIEAEAAALRVGATTAFIAPRATDAEAQALIERIGATMLITDRTDVSVSIGTLHVGDQYERALELAPSNEPHVGWAAHGKVVIFTSGTTGRPKGALRSLDQAVSPSLFAGFLRTIPMRADDVHMVVCPLYHSSGSGFASVAEVLGNTMVLVDRFSPEAFCSHVQANKVTTTTVVPTMLHRLASWPQARDYDLSSLRAVVCTGAPLREEVRREIRELIGNVVYDLYGSTEMGWVTVATPEDQLRKPGTVGKPVEGVQIRILDAQGRALPEWQPGEVWVRSALQMKEYYDDPELTAMRMKDGFLSVRDVGYVDDEQYLHLIDRSDDMIISGGVNVYPAEAEVALGSHPAVGECAVIGVPDPEWGQRIVAAVVTSGEVTPDELVAWCKAHASYAAVPKEVRIVDELPHNDIGKIDKRALANIWS